MQSNRLGVVAVVVAAALWTQLALIPVVISADRATGVDPLAVVAALVALGLAVAAPFVARTRATAGVALMLAGFPLALGVFALLAGRHALARFDAPARMIAATTGVAHVAVTLAWAQSMMPVFPATVAPSDPVTSRTAPPPLRRAALAALAAVAWVSAVVLPAMVAGRAPVGRADRLGGEPLLRAREAITSAGGLGIALLVVLGLGSSLVRGRSARRRRATRALAYLVWALAVGGLFGLLMMRDGWASVWRELFA